MPFSGLGGGGRYLGQGCLGILMYGSRPKAGENVSTAFSGPAHGQYMSVGSRFVSAMYGRGGDG